MNSDCYLANLPDELLLLIMVNLDCQDIICVRMVSYYHFIPHPQIGSYLQIDVLALLLTFKRPKTLGHHSVPSCNQESPPSICGPY